MSDVARATSHTVYAENKPCLMKRATEWRYVECEGVVHGFRYFHEHIYKAYACVIPNYANAWDRQLGAVQTLFRATTVAASLKRSHEGGQPATGRSRVYYRASTVKNRPPAFPPIRIGLMEMRRGIDVVLTYAQYDTTRLQTKPHWQLYSQSRILFRSISNSLPVVCLFSPFANYQSTIFSL